MIPPLKPATSRKNAASTQCASFKPVPAPSSRPQHEDSAVDPVSEEDAQLSVGRRAGRVDQAHQYRRDGDPQPGFAQEAMVRPFQPAGSPDTQPLAVASRSRAA